MFKKTLTTILATVTALAITALPVSAAEPGYVTVGDAAHGYVDVPSDWVQDTTVTYYADGTATDEITWGNPNGTQYINLRRENVPSNGLSEQESMNNLFDWVLTQKETRPDEYQNFDCGDAGTIAGHEAFWASWTTPAQYMLNSPFSVDYKVFYFVDDNYIYNIEAQTNDGDMSVALQAASTFHF